MANLRLSRGVARILPLLIFISTRVGVSAQLYTNLEAVAAAYPDNITLSDGHLEGVKDLKVKRMCMVPFEITDKDRNPNMADEWGFHRDGTNQHRYFCGNVPLFKHNDPKNKASPSGVPGGHLRSPHSQFWLEEDSSTNWQRFKLSQRESQMGAYMGAKNRGLLFLIEVTGIQSRGRFLKGWYHLKISVQIDHNAKNEFKDKTPDNYAISKLMVTARGRSLVPAKPRNMTLKDGSKGYVRRPPRRTWIGSIGEFVHDFPKCKDYDTNTKSVPQQFMTCGTVQYGEAKHGNNFYYSRQNKDAKYGSPQEVKAFHLNFRLDNSFCNRYYDLDFVAIGMVQVKDAIGDINREFQPVLRSVSTRFIFASSYAHHQPDYYENADPVPRNVPNVDCSHHLRGEWEMNNSTEKPPNTHRMSITKGADLKLSGARPDATFNGAIKFIIQTPKNLKNTSADDTTFDSRRTWTYSFRLMRYGRQDGREYDHNPFRYWTDEKLGVTNDKNQELRNKNKPFAVDVPKTEAAIQRVLNELDWETWVERMRVQTSLGVTIKNCDVNLVYPNDYENPANSKSSIGWSYEAGYWPNHYYDNTCGGMDIHKIAHDRNFEWDSHPQDGIWDENTVNRSTFSTELSTFYKAFPPISGRCAGSLYFNSGMGNNNINPPPRCNEFFRESEMWTDNVEGYAEAWNKAKAEADKAGKKEVDTTGFEFHHLAVADPALARVVEGMRRQTKGGGGRNTFNDHYLADTLDDRNQLTCELAEALWAEKPDCTFIPPRPYTPRAPYHVPPTKEEQAVLDWEDKQKRDHKTTPAYTRGLLVSENPYSLYIWDSRLIHGCFMTVLTIFVTPISIFFTRYYKETFMDTRILLHHIWYFVHIIFSLITQLLLLVGMWRQAKAKDILGVSLGGNSKVHRIVGWMMVGLSGFLFISGGIRTMHRKIRAATMLVHWFGGMIFYACCLLCMLSSFGITGSPAAYHDYTTSGFNTTLQQRYPERKHEAVFITIVVWILFDIIMHVVMTILQCRNDKKMKLTESRFYFLSPMPVIAETFRFDTPGRFPRIYLLGVYIFMSFAATTVIIVFMYNYSPRGRGLGFMSCTHSSDPAHDVLETFPKNC